jgi:hypothetical protein
MPLTSPDEVRAAVTAVLRGIADSDFQAIEWGATPLRISKRMMFPAGAVVVERETINDLTRPDGTQQTVEVGVVAAFNAVGYEETAALRDAMAKLAAAALLDSDAQGLNDRTVGVAQLQVDYDGIPEDQIAWFDMTVTYEVLGSPA